MKTFFWILVGFASLSWGRAYYSEQVMLDSQEFKSLYQQKQANDHQIDLEYEKLAPINSAITNIVGRINGIDQAISSLASEADQLSLEKSSLKAEYDSTLSGPSIISMGGRAFFDGLTLGQFAEKGPMTESLKYQKWLTDISKRDAVTIERANQIQRKWVDLESQRKDAAAELLKLQAQGIPLIKPFTDELNPKNNDLIYKLKPYKEALKSYEHQRSVAAFIFWPALWFALTVKRSVEKPKGDTVN